MQYRAMSADVSRSNSTTINEEEAGQPGDAADKAKKQRMLVLSFVAMIFVGLGNKIFQKLETIPMYNYPNWLNLLTTGMYIPVSFAYVIPASRAGWITKDQFEVPKRDFAVMGFLDCLAGIMQIFAATYLPGSLLVLLTQSAIPISMVLSKLFLGLSYHQTQYIAATVVCGGIILVLAPSIFGDGGDGGGATVLWSAVLIASCVPMCLSSIYKEIALGSVDLDPVYLNAWIAVFQFAFSLPLAIPAAIAGSPPVYPGDLPQNLWEGFLCYLGRSSSTCDDDSLDDCHVDKCYVQGPLFVNVYLVFNIGYNILIIFILKYGSANILWLAMTVMVPLGNLAFALPFMPQNTTITPFDLAGLVVIMVGLVGYRKGPEMFPGKKEPGIPQEDAFSASSIDKNALLDGEDVN